MTAFRITLILVGIALLISFAIPLFYVGVFNSGNCIGMAGSIMLVLYGALFKRINGFVVYLSKHLAGKVVLICFSLLAIAILAFVVIISINIVRKANDPPKEPTTVVVLGCRVRESGASTMLKTRLEAAYTFLTDNPQLNCVLSGGKGADEPVAEGVYMYNWLVERGIDPSRLYVEDKSTSTEENLKLTKKLIEEKELEPKITIITNDFHQYRAYRFAKETGFESYSYSARSPLYMLPTYYVREVCGVAHMIFID